MGGPRALRPRRRPSRGPRGFCDPRSPSSQARPWHKVPVPTAVAHWRCPGRGPSARRVSPADQPPVARGNLAGRARAGPRQTRRHRPGPGEAAAAVTVHRGRPSARRRRALRDGAEASGRARPRCQRRGWAAMAAGAAATGRRRSLGPESLSRRGCRRRGEMIASTAPVRDSDGVATRAGDLAELSAGFRPFAASRAPAGLALRIRRRRWPALAHSPRLQTLAVLYWGLLDLPMQPSRHFWFHRLLQTKCVDRRIIVTCLWCVCCVAVAGRLECKLDFIEEN